tara:strand:+ start:4020 stop:8858 length:4839 start_codon:yes stop_codon:yes gene_type:complete
MPQFTRNFIKGRMNKSVDERLVAQGEYIDALNCRLGSTENTEIGAVENSLGNSTLTILTYEGQALSDKSKCIGSFEDGGTETLYWFVNDPANETSSTGKVDMIVSYNTNLDLLFYHVISTSLLNFNNLNLVTGINLIDGLLFFTDNLNAPRKINVNRTYPYPISDVDQIFEQDIGVILAPPLFAPTLTPIQQGGGENFMKDIMISFAYRYKYEDNEYSAISPFSPISFTPGPFSLDFATYNNASMENVFNSVIVEFNTGGRNVVGIDLLFKNSEMVTVNVIEKFNKVDQGWLDNINQTFQFTNQKIYTVLPAAQMLRLYDNVPRYAQAQTIMGNRLMYGNYIDGYNITNSAGQSVYLDYTLERVSESLGAGEKDSVNTAFTYTINGAVNQLNATASYDTTGFALITGSQIGISFNFGHGQFSGSATYIDGNEPLNEFVGTFLFTLQQNFDNAHDMVTSQAFIDGITTFVAPSSSNCFPIKCSSGCTNGSSVTDLINCGIVTNAAGGWEKVGFGLSGIDQGIVITSTPGSNVFTLTPQALKFEAYNQATVPPTALGVFAFEYLTIRQSELLYSLDSSRKTLHSDRDYEVAVVYEDEYGRASTALVDINNTIYMPCENSITKNTIKITLSSYPPFWAKKYKFVLKPSKDEYRTVFSNIFFPEEETGNVWFKLEGDNKSKVVLDENLKVKADTTGAVLRCVETKVLDYGSQVKDFLCARDSNGVKVDPDCTQPGGVYMQLRPSNFAAAIAPDSLINTGQETCSSGDFCAVKYSVSIKNPDSTGATDEFIPYTIPAGSIVTIILTESRSRRGNRCGAKKYNYNKTFTAGQDYESMYAFVEGQNIDLTNGSTDGTTDDGGPNNINQPSTLYSFFTRLATDSQSYVTFQTDAANGKMYLVHQTGTQKCRGLDIRNSYATVELIVQRATTLMIFETEAKDANTELYFENEQVFDITSGNHQSGSNTTDQNQTSLLPAIINLTFSNAFVFGNGCESNRVLDALTTQSFTLGEKVTAVSEEDYKENLRFADITYSGNFNLETNVNKLNEFNLALANFKSLESSFGPIRKLHARQTDILTLQEDKISYVLVEKNLLSDAAAGGAIASIPEVLGTQLARIEEYGISNNPESFAHYGYDVFFTDAKRSSVLNLRGGISAKSDKLEVISNQGMRSWFRDLFTDDFNTQKLGGYDPYMDEYVLSSNSSIVPVEPTKRDCGYNIRQTLSSKAVVFDLNCTSTIGIVSVVYNFTAGSAVLLINYNGIDVVNQTISGTGTLTWNKNQAFPVGAQVTITPTAATYSVTIGCPSTENLTVKRIVINESGDASLTSSIRYRWSDGVTTSPFQSDNIILEEDGTSLFASQTGPASFGTIPTSGSTVTMQNLQPSGDTFIFDPLSDKFKYLVSNVNYNEADINTLIPLLNTATPITLTGLNTYSAPFTYSNAANNDYLYLVWDYRVSTAIELCYDASSSTSSCCDCGTDAPTCPDRTLVFQVCNSNSAKDDNFDVYLNNNYIGALDLNSNTQAGSVFIASNNASSTIVTSDFVCPLNLMVTYRFNPNFVVGGANTLELRNTQSNNNGNFGSIGLRNYLTTGNNLTSPCVVTDLVYSGSTGQSFNISFNYTECCP